MLPLNQGLCSDSEQKSEKAKKQKSKHYVKILSENNKAFFVFFWLEILKNGI
jgi:hypothetical protein